MKNNQNYSGFVRLGVVVSILVLTTLVLNLVVVAEEQDKQPSQKEVSIAAFQQAYKVFLHPRCVNCHPTGRVPLQSDTSVPHQMRVQGGHDGKGIPGMKCMTCHTDQQMSGKHMPPGAPNWHLPHPDMPLVFQNRTPKELAKQLKDPKQNGGKTLEQILKHVSADPLVLWGWNPGEGRTTPPISHKEFVQHMKTWIENGAAEPEK